MALLQLWQRLDSSVQRERPELSTRMLTNIGERLEWGNRGGWQAPPEFATELFEWLPRTRDLNVDGQLDSRLLRGALAQLPHQLELATPEVWPRLLTAICASDGEILARSRTELQRKDALRRAFEERIALPGIGSQTPYDLHTSAAMAFRCAALGLDGSAIKELLRSLLVRVAEDFTKVDASTRRDSTNTVLAGQLCWACAEVRAHADDALQLASRVALTATESGEDSNFDGKDTTATSNLSWLRLAWASLALGGDNADVGKLASLAASGGGDAVVQALTAADVRPARQLAWHIRSQFDAVAPDASVRWTEAVLAEESWGSYDAAVGRRLSELLQHMRVPHVASSPLVLPGGIYRIPAWFPQPGAVLDVDARGDLLASGATSGAADLRRRQLQSRGIRVLSIDAGILKSSGSPKDGSAQAARQQGLRAVAETVAEVCPEARAWLRSSEGKAALAAFASASESVNDDAALGVTNKLGTP